MIGRTLPANDFRNVKFKKKNAKKHEFVLFDAFNIFEEFCNSQNVNVT